jgi:hypothetical protein
MALVLTTAAMAAPHPFYETMLARGVAAVQGGRYTEGIKTLRIAAFGSIDNVPSYQTAQVYLALAYEKLGENEAARLSATKFLQSERIRPSYEALTLDAATRNAFEKVVASAVEPQYLAQIPSFRRSSPAKNSAVATRGRDLPVQPQATPEQPKTEADSPAKPPVEKREVPKQNVQTTPAPAAVKPQPAQPVAQTSSSAAAPTAKSNQPPTAINLTAARPVINAETPTPQPRTPAPQTAAVPPATGQPGNRATTPSKPAAIQQPAELQSAQQLLNEGKLLAAREAYLRLAQRRDLARVHMLEVGRGLNRAGAWQESAFVYQRTLPMQKGEELHMFYEAVNRYELGELNVARSLFGQALPALAASREVDLYRVKIQGTE